MGAMIPYAVGAAVGALAVPLIELILELITEIGKWLDKVASGKDKAVWAKSSALLGVVAKKEASGMAKALETGFAFIKKTYAMNPYSFSAGLALGALAYYLAYRYSRAGSSEEAESVEQGKKNFGSSFMEVLRTPVAEVTYRAFTAAASAAA